MRIRNINLNIRTVYRFGSSIKITVSCLFCLFVLTFVGTYYQADHGLYAAQNRFFYSWVILLLGVIPFPGAKSVLTILAINLIFAVFRYSYRWEKVGIITIHYGIIFLLLASFFTHYFSRESVVVLAEGQSTDVSLDYFHSEIAIWEIEGDAKKVVAYDAKNIGKNDNEEIFFSKYGVGLTPLYYYEHASPANFQEPGVVNSSGITSLLYLTPPKSHEGISPGGLFQVRVEGSPNTPQKVILWEGEPSPFPLILADGRTVYMKLQRIRYPLPFSIKLKKFIKDEYFGTTIAKGYESLVEVTENGVTRDARVFMNNPLRSQGFIFFQASFAQDQMGNRQSVLATVANRGYWIPYAAGIIISLGIIFHFIVMFIKRIKRINLSH